MSDIQFYTNPQSRGGIVHWMLEELGEPYDTHWINYGEQMKGPEYLAVNPMGKVPALVHRGNTMSNSTYICGDEFMAADVYVGSALHWAMMFGAVEKRQRFEDYVGNLMQRPAAVRSQQLIEARQKVMEASA